MLKRIPVWAWAAVVVVLVGGWWLLRDDAPKVEYRTSVVENGDIVTSISASGKIQAVNTVEVGSQLSGQVTALYADFNTPVKMGQVIGATDRLGGEPSERPVLFGEVFATLYHQLGIDVNTATIVDPNGRPQYLLDRREVVRELL